MANRPNASYEWRVSVKTTASNSKKYMILSDHSQCKKNKICWLRNSPDQFEIRSVTLQKVEDLDLDIASAQTARHQILMPPFYTCTENQTSGAFTSTQEQSKVKTKFCTNHAHKLRFHIRQITTKTDIVAVVYSLITTTSSFSEEKYSRGEYAAWKEIFGFTQN